MIWRHGYELTSIADLRAMREDPGAWRIWAVHVIARLLGVRASVWR